MSLVQIDELTIDLRTKDGPFRVMERQSLTVPRGGVLGVVGESGSGKTMLLRAIMDVLPEGASRAWTRAYFDNTEVQKGFRLDHLPIAMIFQDPMTSFNPLARIGTHLVEVAQRHEKSPRHEARRKAIDALRAARIPDPERVFACYPHELSGGLRQRAMIAMALLADPRLLLADEPTTALDATAQTEILALLRQLQQERDLTVLIVTHDLGVVAALCDTVIVMKDGEIVERADVDTLFQSPVHPYTRELLTSLPGRSET